MPNIQYTISAKQVNGLAEVRVRFYSGKINQRAATNIFVPLNQWDNANGRCIINRRFESPINAQARKAQQTLDELSSFIYAQYTQDALNITDKWLRQVVYKFNNPHESAPPLHEIINDYCNARNVAPATQKKMQALRVHLANFAADHYPLYAATITKRDLELFAAFLMYKNGVQVQSRNSVSGRLRQLRTLVYWTGKPHPNPFEDFTIPAETYGTPIYLTKEERDFLYLYNDFTPKKRIQRDIFIFQCHTGCRVSDLYSLTPANISADGWLVYVPQKTARNQAKTIEVPLSATALEIVERYKGKDAHGRLFPFISEPQYGKAITAICKQAALTRPVMVLNPRTFQTTAMPLWTQVTSHTARKTFTQIVYSAITDKRLVASLTGHSENSQAFNRYSEISKEMKRAAVLGENLANNLPPTTNHANNATQATDTTTSNK